MNGDTDKKTVIDQALLDACIHCGMCLPACPTYLATGRELESPRGRIALLNLWQQGQQPFSARMAEHLDSCLGCLGCQTACPSGVNYEALITEARQRVNSRQAIWLKLPRNFIFHYVLTNDRLLVSFGNILRFIQKHNIDKNLSDMVRSLQLTKLPILNELLRWWALLPQIPEHKILPKLTTGSNKQMSVAQLFKGCVMDIFYNQVNHDTIELLSRSCQIVGVPKQSCCGALALHAGEKGIACQLTKLNIENFASNPGPIVVTASGCAAMLKTCHELFSDDDPWHERAKIFSKRVQDLPEFLAENCLPIKDLSNTVIKPVRIAYHAACHLAHAQGVHLAPKEILDSYAKSMNEKAGRQLITIVPLTEEEHCCGSAGIYNLSHPTLSEEILSRKIEMIEKADADIVITTNPGCLLQIESGLRVQGSKTRVLHLAELLTCEYF